jgi:hypothetical protein
MGSVSDIVVVNITRTTKSVSRAGFGTGLILGPNATAMKKYTSMDAVAADFATGNSEYKAAAAYFSQELKPTSLWIGKRTAKVAQVETFTPTAADNTVFSVTIDGVVYSFNSGSSATATTIVTGLKTAINADAACLAAATGTTTLILTGKTAGSGFDASSTGAGVMSQVHTTLNNGVVEDVEAAQRAGVGSDDWYMLFLCSRAQDDILAAAKYIETLHKMLCVCTNDAGVIASTTTDTAYLLKSKNYDRTFFLYSGDQANFPETGWAGGLLPFDPGTETWKFKTIKGNSSDNLNATEQNNAQGKHANIYYPVGGVDITSEGVCASGEFIDVMRFIDWIHSEVTANVFQRLVSLPKVPFTDTGIAMIEGDIRAVLAKGERVGGFAPGSTYVIVPKAADVSVGDKAARLLEDVEFGGVLAGAIHKVKMTGKISV